MQLEWSLKYRYHFYPFIASNIKLRLLSKVLKKFIYKNIYLFLTGLLIFVLIFLFLCVIDPTYNLQYHAFKEFKPFDGLNKPSSIKNRLIKEMGHKCQKCQNNSWNDISITLELEHIDGNNRNNSRENLTLLCPNCHSQTPTWRNRKR